MRSPTARNMVNDTCQHESGSNSCGSQRLPRGALEKCCGVCCPGAHETWPAKHILATETSGADGDDVSIWELQVALLDVPETNVVHLAGFCHDGQTFWGNGTFRRPPWPSPRLCLRALANVGSETAKTSTISDSSSVTTHCGVQSADEAKRPPACDRSTTWWCRGWLRIYQLRSSGIHPSEDWQARLWPVLRLATPVTVLVRCCCVCCCCVFECRTCECCC